MSANGNSTKLDLTTLHTLIYWCQKDQNFYNKSSVLLETHDENEIRVRIQKYPSNKILCIYIRGIKGKTCSVIVEEFLITNKNMSLQGNCQRKSFI